MTSETTRCLVVVVLAAALGSVHSGPRIASGEERDAIGAAAQVEGAAIPAKRASGNGAGAGAKVLAAKPPADQLVRAPGLEEAAGVVDGFHDKIIDVCREAEQLGYAGRLERLSPAVDAAFDLRYMAQKVVGRHWKEFTPEERQRWLQTFGGFMKANYAGRFDGYSGQAFENLGEEPAAHDTVTVRTRLNIPDAEHVDLTYRLRPTDVGWLIIDIYLKGTVSELALRRSEYSSVLKREGFEPLVELLNRKVTELAEGRAAP
jgi:phospholipid transport system substrate-binding protein